MGVLALILHCYPTAVKLNAPNNFYEVVIMAYKKQLCSIVLAGFAGLSFPLPAHATIYFSYNAESGAIGSNVPTASNPYEDSFFCGAECGGTNIIATIANDKGAPQGTKYYQWNVAKGTHDVFVQAKNNKYFSFAAGNLQLTVGTTYYMAYWINLDRNGGPDIYNASYGYDKDGQLCDGGCTTRSSVSWSSGHGKEFGCYDAKGVSQFASNLPGHYTMWLGNTNKDAQNNNFGHVLGGNNSGYSCSNPYQISFDKWHPVVMAVTMACGNTGRVQLWIDGVKTHDYQNIITVDYEDDGKTCKPEISRLQFGGTLNQPDYNVAAHIRKYDALMLTDNWQDIVNGGYLSGTTPPTPCTEAWTCSAWSAWSTCCTNNTQSRTKTCTDSKNCGTTTTKPATTETQSCTSITTYNITNFTQLVTDWLKTISSSPADVNKDGKVNSQDLGIMMSNWQ